MQVRKLSVPDAFEFTPRSFPDSRGLFVAPFQEAALIEATGHPMRLAQTNHSVSVRGAIRGLHFADTPPGQAKYVYCPRGALMDVVVDLRVGSPTFGAWDAARLDSTDFRAVYISEGIGHAFVALEEDTVMAYLCSTPYNPAAEHAVNPMDPMLGIPWESYLDGVEPVLSDKDRGAPSLAEAVAADLLPKYEACQAHYASLRSVLVP
ncbi:dTDP-4-dehydrorhamnose 3,5-epimerase family protein [Allokutzneria sp. NRRL B-24872]|uniref:dTDP-4-dehydrorhamnose 3,5-epimerase family protein n=1 Tax=Allokutzneria sp. NRRL B-24872 TaxID=1137961 RepID=UPI000A38766D|nr:dTDP-4-dehydrorhamnose 3,5-epimerase family protein [Allokutzneria sp. NRRL B-24872]